MKLWVTILAVLLPLTLAEKEENAYTRCYTGLHFYKIDCNTCWCVGSGTPVCSKLLCEKLPETFKGFSSHKQDKNSVTNNVKLDNGKTVKVTIFPD